MTTNAKLPDLWWTVTVNTTPHLNRNQKFLIVMSRCSLPMHSVSPSPAILPCRFSQINDLLLHGKA